MARTRDLTLGFGAYITVLVPDDSYLKYNKIWAITSLWQCNPNGDCSIDSAIDSKYKNKYTIKGGVYDIKGDLEFEFCM